MWASNGRCPEHEIVIGAESNGRSGYRRCATTTHDEIAIDDDDVSGWFHEDRVVIEDGGIRMNQFPMR